jgi:predicted MPP superfamily phosphohydrolase
LDIQFFIRVKAVPRIGDDASVTILHVSDTQFGRYHRFDPSDSLAGHLIRDVASLSRIGVPTIDLIVLSGDIAERGKRAEYADALRFVDHLCEELGLGRERVVVVPGNHDVSWDLSEAYFAECRDEEVDPQIPYAKKWRHYQNLVTELHDPAAFTRGTALPVAPVR